MAPPIQSDRDFRPGLFVLVLRVSKRDHKTGHALATVGIVSALHFAGAVVPGTVVDGLVGPVGAGINADLLRPDSLACRQAAGCHFRLFDKTVPEFLHMAQADPYAGVVCVRGEGSSQKKANNQYSAGLDRRRLAGHV